MSLIILISFVSEMVRLLVVIYLLRGKDSLYSLIISSVTEVGEIWRPKSQPKLKILYKKPVDTETVSVLRNLPI